MNDPKHPAKEERRIGDPLPETPRRPGEPPDSPADPDRERSDRRRGDIERDVER